MKLKVLFLPTDSGPNDSRGDILFLGITEPPIPGDYLLDLLNVRIIVPVLPRFAGVIDS